MFYEYDPTIHTKHKTPHTERWLDTDRNVIYYFNDLHTSCDGIWRTYDNRGRMLVKSNALTGELIEAHEYDDKGRIVKHSFSHISWTKKFYPFGVMATDSNGDISYSDVIEESPISELDWLGHIGITNDQHVIAHGGKFYELVEISIDGLQVL